MHKTHAKRRRDIKTKLMAAICMLLVSSIMMVSTTYAWFTLSTAPEVTGISTAVGANGNLEMALLPLDGITNGAAKDANFGITSSASDSNKALNERNVTWGNLVDLDFAVNNVNYYGLDKIKLYPAALNVPEGTEDRGGNPTVLDSAFILKTPAYGADGRVSALKAEAITSTYDTTGQNFPQNKYFGVRAVGAASGMTDRQLAYRGAASTANTNKAQAKSLASQSLNTNGASLANIAIAHAANASATHTKEDIGNLLKIVYDLLGKSDTEVNGYEPAETGILEFIEEAYRQQIIAIAASRASQNVLNDDAFKSFQSTVNGAASVYAVVDMFATGGTYASLGITLPTQVTVPVAALKVTRQNVEAAKTGLEGQYNASKTEYKWEDFSTYLFKLADTSAMKINGYAASTLKENMSAIVNGVASQGLTVTMATGGGVYADVADHCGDYTASITIKEVSYNGLTLENMNARMETATTVSPLYLDALVSHVNSLLEPSSEGGQVMPISEMYGYIIDLAFRTNAADSNLLLQIEAKDRIYNSSEGAQGSEETMGHGSTMTFTSTTTDFTLTQMKGLMEAIRIVFYNPLDQKVMATAKLDMGGTPEAPHYTTTGGNTITAKMYIYELTKAGTVTEYIEAIYIADTTAEGGYRLATDTETATHALVGGAYVEAEYVVDTPASGTTAATYREATGTETATHAIHTYTTVDGEVAKTGSDAVITALTQNTATAVSVLVYLDGENVGNDDVAATAATSMTGTMNLQFASSAPLVPMEYTPLMNQDSSDTVTVTVPEGVTGATTATKGTDYTFTVNSGYTLNTVTIGGTAITPTLSDGTYTIDGDDITGNIIITVTATG